MLEYDGGVCVLEVIGVPSILSVIRKQSGRGYCRLLLSGWTGSPGDGSGIVHWWIVQAELLKLQKIGQFPDESVRITV
jgi:hypothetical protein